VHDLGGDSTQHVALRQYWTSEVYVQLPELVKFNHSTELLTVIPGWSLLDVC
jgi:hypothetical protein